MIDYKTAIMFELAGNVRRTLAVAGRKPTIEDNRYIHELRHRLYKEPHGLLREINERYPFL